MWTWITELTEYERRVVAQLRAGSMARLSELPMLQPSGLRRWHRQFRREVQAEARERGPDYLDTSTSGTRCPGVARRGR